MRIFDSNYSDWKVGDKVVWCDKRDICPLFTITEINVSARWAFWEDSGTRQGSQWENLVRVTESNKPSMADLEKFINDLCELPRVDLEGDDTNDAIHIYYAAMQEHPFVVLDDWDEPTYLTPSQALSLFSWLAEQRHNLEQLRDALQAQKAQEEATKTQREAERLTALDLERSEAVTAWQQGGCEGPCPSFEDIANPKVEFIRKYPVWERLMKERRG